jgi:hypothetical protein
MVDQIENLISDCDVVLSHLLSIDSKSAWFVVGGPPIKGECKRVSAWLDDLNDSAARIDVEDPPPAPPARHVLFVGMTTKRGVPLALDYVRALRRWGASLLPKANPGKAENSDHQTETEAKNEPTKPIASLGATLDEQAVAVFVSRKGQVTKKEIARILVESGIRETCHEKSLAPSRCPHLDQAIRAYRDGHSLPHGSKDREGNVEAYEDE